MTKTVQTIRLTDIQLVLLCAAAARDNGSLLPPPQTLGNAPARIRKGVEQLIKRSFAAEADLPEGGDAWRIEGDRQIGLVITDAGRAAIHVEKEDAQEEIAPVIPQMAVPPAQPAATPTKTAMVLGLLRRDDGATLDELVAATGWLPHTTRAALTGLRKKGHAIERGKRADVSCYTLVAAEAVAA